MSEDDFSALHKKPVAVRMAEEVLSLWDENQRLRYELEELREYRQKYLDSLQQGINHSGEMISIVFGALMDPESRISKAIALEEPSHG